MKAGLSIYMRLARGTERRRYMTQEENLCIYTKENDTEAHFRNQEHIIPACIGGMQKLPKGYVSDEIE